MTELVNGVNDEEMHGLARAEAAGLVDPDRKQLRFNEIVGAARRFYPSDPAAGVREIVQSCDRAQPALYVKGDPMWSSLPRNWGWAFPEGGEA